MAATAGKFLHTAFNAALMAFSGYEYGKSSGLEHQQVVLATPAQPIIKETNDTVYYVGALIVLAIIAFFAWVTKEIVKCRNFTRARGNDIPLNNIPAPRAATQNQGIGVIA